MTGKVLSVGGDPAPSIGDTSPAACNFYVDVARSVGNVMGFD